MRITVKVYEHNEEILSKVLGEGVYRVGRSEFSDIVLPGDSVSRSHLEIRVTEASVYVTNMSSSGKVRINGQPLETGELNDGDEVHLGPYKLIVLHGAEEAIASPLGLPSDEPPASGEADGGDGNGDGQDDPIGAVEPGPVGDDNVADLFENALSQVGEQAPDLPRDDAGFASPAPQFEGTAALNRAETVVEMKPVVAKLVFTDGPRQGEEIFLEAYEITFGRSKRADIYLDDEKLSRVHAKIARVGMGYRLIDLNSRNGTYVNGMRILEHPLSSFDTIELGHSKIRFLIHDVISSDAGKGGGLMEPSGAGVPLEQTRSLQLDASGGRVMLDFPRGPSPNSAINNEPVGPMGGPPVFAPPKGLSKRTRIALLLILVLVGVYFVLPDSKPPAKKDVATTASTSPAGDRPPAKPNVADVRQPPLMSREYLELTPEMQRSIEGRYNSALRAAEQENYDAAVNELRKIHEVLPYYKQSKELLEQYGRRLKEKQVQEAADKAKKDDKQELQMLLEDGLEYLRQGEFDRAGENFNSVMNLDPNNATAIKGLKAAEYKLKDINLVPPDRDPEKEKVKQVKDLFQRAVEAFARKSYQEAIDTAEQIRKVELKGDTQYLNEAKQIIDRSRMLQKEEFEPFLTEAKEKYAEGDYNAARDLTEEMIKRNPEYDEAKEILNKTKKQLERLAKEAYVRGYILESMNRIDEAKQYWNRAKNYVRPGDSYFDKVNKKLDQYQ